MIVIVDYGLGNLHSVYGAFRSAGARAEISDRPEKIAAAAGVVLPGVGAFGRAMDNLRRQNLEGPLKEFVASGRPFLGICLGLQLMFARGEEHGTHRGLGFLPGVVRRFPAGIKVPHIGWNEVESRGDSPLFAGLARDWFYFANSYRCEPENEADILGLTEYGETFASAAGRPNLFGVQFHPEKSATAGQRMIRNFAGLCREESP